VNQDVAALRQLDDGIVGTAVAGVTNRSLTGIDPEGETLEISSLGSDSRLNSRINGAIGGPPASGAYT
jgi:hypothetical protein